MQINAKNHDHNADATPEGTATDGPTCENIDELHRLQLAAAWGIAMQIDGLINEADLIEVALEYGPNTLAWWTALPMARGLLRFYNVALVRWYVDSPLEGQGGLG
jgi:hypothetical protein